MSKSEIYIFVTLVYHSNLVTELNNCILNFRLKMDYVKVDRWFEHTVEMFPRQFRRFFRMNDTILNAVVQLLHTNAHIVKYQGTAIPVLKKSWNVLYLSGNNNPNQSVSVLTDE